MLMEFVYFFFFLPLQMKFIKNLFNTKVQTMFSTGNLKKIRDLDVITPKQQNMTDETTFEESEREELAAQNTADLTGLQSRKCATWQECGRNNSYFIGKVETTMSEKWTSPI